MSELSDIKNKLNVIEQKLNGNGNNHGAISERVCDARMDALTEKLDGIVNVNVSHFETFATKLDDAIDNIDLKLQPFNSWKVEHADEHKAISGRIWALIIGVAIELIALIVWITIKGI